MPAVLKTNHALLFDGVTDSVIIPQGLHSKVGNDDASGNRSAGDIVGDSADGGRGPSIVGDIFRNTIVVEAWVTPDCGGVIVSKDDQFKWELLILPVPLYFQWCLKVQVIFLNLELLLRH